MANVYQFLILHHPTMQRSLIISTDAEAALEMLGYARDDCTILYSKPLPSFWLYPGVPSPELPISRQAIIDETIL